MLFELAEAYTAEQQWDRALEQWATLAELATTLAAGDEQQLPWAASVALRRCEVLVMDRQYAMAVPLLLEARQSFDQFPKRHEFDFLLARCAIANIEFEAALDTLRSLSQSNSSDAAVTARALWMEGEVFLLQRDYAQALDCYQRAAGTTSLSEWQQRGLLQAGKCYELLGKPLSALAAYQQIEQSCPIDDNSPWASTIRQQATQRLAAIKSANTTYR